MQPALADGFTLALGGGGGRGWAHIGVALALEEAGLRPARIIGTSMGAVVGAGMAAGLTAREMERMARRTRVYELVRRRGRFSLFDARPAVARIVAGLGNPRIEELPTPLAITAYDLVSGRPTAIRSGSLGEALERSIAVPLFFAPCEAANGIWCDAGPWESVPVSLARAWSDDPVVGVWADLPKPAVLGLPPVAAALRATSRLLGTGGASLTARRYLALLASRMADPVHEEAPDLLIRPRLGLAPAWYFSRVRPAVRAGYQAARRSLTPVAGGLLRAA